MPARVRRSGRSASPSSAQRSAARAARVGSHSRAPLQPSDFGEKIDLPHLVFGQVEPSQSAVIARESSVFGWCGFGRFCVSAWDHFDHTFFGTEERRQGGILRWLLLDLSAGGFCVPCFCIISTPWRL